MIYNFFIHAPMSGVQPIIIIKWLRYGSTQVKKCHNKDIKKRSYYLDIHRRVLYVQRQKNI